MATISSPRSSFGAAGAMVDTAGAMVDIAAMLDTAAAIVMADGAGPASDWVSVLRQAQSSAAHLHRRTITIRTPTLRRLACTMAPLTTRSPIACNGLGRMTLQAE